MPKTNAVKVTAAREPAVRRGAIASARGTALDAAVAKVGIARMRGESDHALQSRALAYAEEWGMLAAEG